MRTDTERVLPRAVVEDRGDGFVVSLQPEPDLAETFANGVARCGDVLRPLGDPKLGIRLDVRAPFNSPAWRTHYACPRRGVALVPPLSSSGLWRPTTARRGDSEPLCIEPPESAVEWFKHRRRHQGVDVLGVQH